VSNGAESRHMYNRLISPTKTNSYSLFGPRGTGKSTWVKHYFSQKNPLIIDLLLPSIEEKYLLHPEYLREQFLANREEWANKVIVIDEVQKVPKLLDVVHSMIEEF